MKYCLYPFGPGLRCPEIAEFQYTIRGNGWINESGHFNWGQNNILPGPGHTYKKYNVS